MEDVFENMPLSRESALWIARGLRAAAEIDGVNAHEIDLIESFELDLGVSPSDRGSFDQTAPSPLKTAAEQDAFVHSLLLLFLSDGKVSAAEHEFLRDVARNEGMDAVRLHKLDRAARVMMLRSFRGVQTTRDQAADIGRALELTEEEIAAALG